MVKRNLSIFFVSMLVLLSLVFIVSCAVSEIKLDQVKEVLVKGEPEVISVVTCKNVDSNHAPIDITDSFPAGTNSIYISVQFKNFTISDHLSVIWTYLDTKKELSAQSFTPSLDGSGYHSFNIKIASEFPIGKYSAELKFNGEVYKTLEFTVGQ